MDRIEADDLLRVIVIDSAIEDYFVGHIDPVRWPETAAGPHGAPYAKWPALVTRFVESPVVSIASIRGRARGHGNELTLACDMRFASTEKAVFGQLEVAPTVLPGGGGVEWLSALCGRSRALEAVLGSNDFDAIRPPPTGGSTAPYPMGSSTTSWTACPSHRQLRCRRAELGQGRGQRPRRSAVRGLAPSLERRVPSLGGPRKAEGQARRDEGVQQRSAAAGRLRNKSRTASR